jgi:predicted DNA-binding transcriptional regulator AlpA
MMLALLTQREAAELLRVTERTLERLRVSGTGPKFIRIGKTKAIRYRPGDVEAWLASRVVASTSEESDAA